MTATTSTAGYTRALAELVSGLKTADPPDEIKHEMSRVLLDCIGCAVAGLVTDGGRIAVDLMKDERGRLEATIIGAGPASVMPAAYANTMLANALDFDTRANAQRTDHSRPGNQDAQDLNGLSRVAAKTHRQHGNSRKPRAGDRRYGKNANSSLHSGSDTRGVTHGERTPIRSYLRAQSHAHSSAPTAGGMARGPTAASGETPGEPRQSLVGIPGRGAPACPGANPKI